MDGIWLSISLDQKTLDAAAVAALSSLMKTTNLKPEEVETRWCVSWSGAAESLGATSRGGSGGGAGAKSGAATTAAAVPPAAKLK